MNNFLNGLSKTLRLASDVIPIYKDTKPIINKVKKIVKNDSFSKKINNNIPKKNNLISNTKNVQNIKEINKKTTLNQSNPQFFI